LEIGCGGSVWLPYFAKHMQCEVWGIDYSAPGVDLCLDNLRAEGVSGNIILGDVFDSSGIPQRSFDVLWTAGFIEHFKNVGWVIGRLAEYLKPGGVMITLVPNLYGFVGWLHRTVDQKVFNAHIKIHPEMLDRLHSEAGFEILSRAQFFGIFSIGVVNFNRFRAQLPGILDAVFWSSILIIQQSICLPFRLLGFHPETRWFSPWILGIYRLPQ
jgi:SAM-dependent methyltransferase